jgi:hypothetical protein
MGQIWTKMIKFYNFLDSDYYVKPITIACGAIGGLVLASDNVLKQIRPDHPFIPMILISYLIGGGIWGSVIGDAVCNYVPDHKVSVSVLATAGILFNVYNAYNICKS